MINTPKSQASPSVIQLGQTKQLVDEYLEDFFQIQGSQAKAISHRYEKLWQTASKLALAGGKRLRPYVMLLAYRAFSDEAIDKVLPAAVACELIHLAMLIHDDVIDRDFTRYGMPNVAGQYLDEYKELAKNDRLHFANTAAVLIGDALIAESHRLLAISSDDLLQLRKAQLAFSTAILHVVGGELIDTESSIRPVADTHAITVARYKTASYSFIGPLSVGAHLAGADEDSIEILTQYADSLGIAFQLKDDLLGTFGNSAITGKSSDTDLREGKRTYLIEQFDKSSTEQARSDFYKLFGRQDLTDYQVDELRRALSDSGAVSLTEAAIDSYASKAESALTELKVSQSIRSEFEQLIQLCVDRDK